MTWRVRDRASFRALAAGSRRRRGALRVTCARLAPAGPPYVAFAVTRDTGSAVLRNRIRRRLRAALRSEAGSLMPGFGYLVGADARTLAVPFGELRTTLRAMLGDLAGAERS